MFDQTLRGEVSMGLAGECSKGKGPEMRASLSVAKNLVGQGS